MRVSIPLLRLERALSLPVDEWAMNGQFNGMAEPVRIPKGRESEVPHY